jgi:hypothetical protein
MIYLKTRRTAGKSTGSNLARTLSLCKQRIQPRGRLFLQTGKEVRIGVHLGIKFEVQQARGSLFCFITLLRGSEAESFTRSVVEFVGDTRAVGLGDVSHALTFG